MIIIPWLNYGKYYSSSHPKNKIEKKNVNLTRLLNIPNVVGYKFSFNAMWEKGAYYY